MDRTSETSFRACECPLPAVRPENLTVKKVLKAAAVAFAILASPMIAVLLVKATVVTVSTLALCATCCAIYKLAKITLKTRELIKQTDVAIEQLRQGRRLVLTDLAPHRLC